MWYTDFVAELEGRFLPGSTTGERRWSFHYRLDGTNSFYIFYDDGQVAAIFERLGFPGESKNLPGVALSGGSVNHMLAIAKGDTFALYVNGQPVFYQAREHVWPTGRMMLKVIGPAVAFDNFKIWDISDLP
jgi:hypothetical protein